MAADLHIHVLEEPCTEEHIAALCSNQIGSRYFIDEPQDKSWQKRHNEAFNVVARTPNIWIGAVSWLKADLLEDSEQYIPSMVQVISDAIGEDLPVLDDVLLDCIVAAFNLPNATIYKLANPKTVRHFLEHHMGKRLFTVSW